MTAEAGPARRMDERAHYLATTEFAEAEVLRLGSDASIRQYFRLRGGPVPALLMDAPSAATTPPCPPDADEAARHQLGYAALVRGSGNSIMAYESAANRLAGRGILVPSVLHRDVARGFAIISDLGAMRISQVDAGSAREAYLYHQAADILDTLRAHPALGDAAQPWPLQAYDALAYAAEAELLSAWYLPELRGRPVGQEEQERLDDAWRQVFEQLTPPRHLVHRDFHADNLMVTAEGIGVLDFQDLMLGQAAYDWASLIEDARRDIDPALTSELYRRAVSGADDPATFERDYAILAAQRNAKILGLFARLARRDGKPRYLELIPRVRRFFAADLARPPLAPVVMALEKVAPELLP